MYASHAKTIPYIPIFVPKYYEGLTNGICQKTETPPRPEKPENFLLRTKTAQELLHDPSRLVKPKGLTTDHGSEGLVSLKTKFHDYTVHECLHDRSRLVKPKSFTTGHGP